MEIYGLINAVVKRGIQINREKVYNPKKSIIRKVYIQKVYLPKKVSLLADLSFWLQLWWVRIGNTAPTGGAPLLLFSSRPAWSDEG